MTDKKIIELAEKTMEEKYCPEHKVCLLGIDECHISCPISYVDDILGVVCGDTIYTAAFLDGFKAAIEFVKSKVSDVRKEYEDTDDFTYEAGGKDALNDLLEAIER